MNCTFLNGDALGWFAVFFIENMILLVAFLIWKSTK